MIQYLDVSWGLSHTSTSFKSNV